MQKVNRVSKEIVQHHLSSCNMLHILLSRPARVRKNVFLCLAKIFAPLESTSIERSDGDRRRNYKRKPPRRHRSPLAEYRIFPFRVLSQDSKKVPPTGRSRFLPSLSLSLRRGKVGKLIFARDDRL